MEHTMVTMEEQEKYLLNLLVTVVQIRTIKQNYTAITKRLEELNQQLETTTDTEAVQCEIDELTTVRNTQVETLTLASNFYEDVACDNPEELFDQLLRNVEINRETNQRTVDPQNVYNILHAALKFYTHTNLEQTKV